MINLLVGTIASGKSTYSSQMAKAGWIIINDDAIVMALHGGNYTYKENLKVLYKSIETHIFHLAVAMGKDVIIDKGLNLTKNSRARWISLAKSLDIPIKAIIFPFTCPEDHAQRRTKIDSRGLSYEKWLKIAQIHFAQYEPPTIDEGFEIIEKHEWKGI